MLTAADLKDMQADELKVIALADFRRRVDPPIDRTIIDMWFHMMAAPASLWLAALTQLHTQSRAHVAKIRRDCERRNGREP